MNITALLDELRQLAQAGLAETTNPYDIERYTHLLHLTSHSSDVLEATFPAAIHPRLQTELGRMTPKVGADAAIFDSAGQILLTQRVDSGRWCLPGGWMEPAESPAKTAVREAFEETGLLVQPVQLVHVFTRQPGASSQATVSVVYLCAVQSGSLRCSHESLAVRYWDLDAVPAWAGLHEQFARAAHRLWATSLSM